MEKYIYNEQNGLWYELQGDYYIPCLVLDEEDSHPIGKWGRKHLRYIKEHRKAQDQMAWVQCMNNIRNAAEEIVNAEVIFA